MLNLTLEETDVGVEPQQRTLTKCLAVGFFGGLKNQGLRAYLSALCVFVRWDARML